MAQQKEENMGPYSSPIQLEALSPVTYRPGMTLWSGLNACKCSLMEMPPMVTSKFRWSRMA